MTDSSRTDGGTTPSAGSRRDDGSSSNPTGSQAADRGRLERRVPRQATRIRKLSFWAAIVLPLVLLSLLAYGLRTWRSAGLFVIVLVVTVLAFHLGHTHRR